MEELRAKLAELQKVKDRIDADCAGLISEREALWEKIHPIKAKIDALAAKEKAIKEKGDYWSLSREIGAVANAIMAIKRAMKI